MIVATRQLWLAFLAVGFVLPAALDAQRLARGEPARSASTVSLPASAPSPLPDSRVRPELLAPAAPFPRAEPASMRVLFVEIPDAIAAQGGSFYHAEQSGWTTLGPRAGLLARGDSLALSYTLMVPPLATPGEKSVGTIRFVTRDNSRAFDVPLMVDVAGRVSISIDPARTLFGAHSGAAVRTGWVVRNAGNMDARVTLDFDGASGWEGRPRTDSVLVVPRGSSVVVPVDVFVPSDASDGDYAFMATVRDEIGNAASASVNLKVERPDVSSASAGVLDVQLGSTRDDLGNDVNALALDLQTRLPGGIQMTGRFGVLDKRSSGLSGNALGRMGFADRQRQLQLRAPNWSAVFGTIGRTEGGLDAVALFGDGGAGDASVGAWRTSVFAAQPVLGDGQYFSARTERRFGASTGGIVYGDHDDAFGTRREARTLAANFSMPTPIGNAVVAMGHRNTTFGSGLAWRAEISERSADWGYSLSGSRSPGGAAAFAQAERTADATVFRRVSRDINASASAWSSADGARADRRFESFGWNAQTSWRASRALNLGLDTRASDWQSEGTLGLVANGDRSIGANADLTHGRYQGRVALRMGDVVRSADLLAIGLVRSRAGQRSLWSGVSAVYRDATLSADFSLDRTEAGVGLPAQQAGMEIRAERLPLWRGRAYAHVELSRYMLGVSGAALTAQTLGVDVRMPGAIGLTVDVSRNALFRRDASAPTPWVVAVRMQRGFGVPGWSTDRHLGVVFLDRNGNGLRDRGEPGLQGVLLRVGEGRIVTTDSRGAFRGPPESEPELDVRSLPDGHLVAPAEYSGTAGDIAIVATAPVEIALTYANAANLELGAIDLSRTIVILRDPRGRVWSNTPSERGTVRFDALPAGQYTLDVETSAVGEPLVVAGGTQRVTVSVGTAVQKLSITLTPRPIRVMPTPRVRRIQTGTQ